MEVWRSGHDGAEVLRAWEGAVHLEMNAGQGAGKLFSGTVDVDAQSALRLLDELSLVLRDAGMRHRIELYAQADGALLGYLDHGWPRGASPQAADDDERRWTIPSAGARVHPSPTPAPSPVPSLPTYLAIYLASRYIASYILR